MKNCINILGNNQSFKYLIEYSKNTVSSSDHNMTNGDDILWSINNNTVKLFEGDIEYYRDINDWYKVDRSSMVNTYIPNMVNTSNIKIYIPAHAISTYIKSIKYAVTAVTWINGIKIDLGSFIFKPTDTYAIPTGPIKDGNNEFYECIDFDIIDPFYLMYADDWIQFRNKVCNEPLGINNTGSSLQISLFVIDEYEDRYLIKDGVIGGITSFIIADDNDFMSLKLSVSNDPLSICFDTVINKEYNWLLTYLNETYGISTSHNNIKYDIVIKNKDSIIIGPTIPYASNETFGHISQSILWSDINNDDGVKVFFSNWNNFETGWNLVASLSIMDNNINDNDAIEVFTIVSNELPITQELFSIFTNGGTEKIIELTDMNVIQYNVVNKIENNIVQLDRPNESKSNIIQPVFFRVNDLEMLTLHPSVTENISINLDDYKSKVERFTLIIADCKFEQIGVNNYGILFKINANVLPSTATSGTYYVLDENKELVTTGKYNCVR